MRDISIAILDDCEGLARLQNISFAAGFERAWSAMDFKTSLVSNDITCFLIKKEDTLIAFLMMRQIFEEAEIILLASDPAYQRKGLATTLIAYALETMEQKGVTRVVLEVREDNYAAMELYKIFGFEEVGQRKAYYALSNGQRKDAKILALSIK